VRDAPASEIFRTPDERFADLPGYAFEPHYSDIDGLRLHYLDEGRGSPVVCFHGEPTWAYLYRGLIAPLVDDGYRVICPDYAGFGRSDKPTDRRWYTYDRHFELVSRLLDSLDLGDATIVSHDWGGPIGLRWAVANEDRVARLVLHNTGLFTGGGLTQGLETWRSFAERNPDLPIAFVVGGGTTTEPTPAVLAAYEAPFPTPESKAGAAQFPLMVPTSSDDSGVAEMQAVADALSRWEKPTLVAFSDVDPVFPYPEAGQIFCDLIPGAGEQVRIEGAAHFLYEDRPDEIAEAILRFLRAAKPA
jgi:haloalkane dehalogenase